MRDATSSSSRVIYLNNPNPYASAFGLLGMILGDNARRREEKEGQQLAYDAAFNPYDFNTTKTTTETKMNDYGKGLLSPKPDAERFSLMPKDGFKVDGIPSDGQYKFGYKPTSGNLMNWNQGYAPTTSVPSAPQYDGIFSDKAMTTTTTKQELPWSDVRSSTSAEFAKRMKELSKKLTPEQMKAYAPMIRQAYADQLTQAQSDYDTKRKGERLQYWTDKLNKAGSLKDAMIIGMGIEADGFKFHPDLVKAAMEDNNYTITSHGAELVAVNKKNPRDIVSLRTGKPMTDYEKATIDTRIAGINARESGTGRATAPDKKDPKRKFGEDGDLTAKEAQHDNLRRLAEEAIKSGDFSSAGEYLDEIGKHFTDAEIGQVAQSDHYYLNQLMGKEWQNRNKGQSYNYNYR